MTRPFNYQHPSRAPGIHALGRLAEGARNAIAAAWYALRHPTSNAPARYVGCPGSFVRDLRPNAVCGHHCMERVFVELPAFERHRADHLDDDGFRELQGPLTARPDAGAVIPGAGGLRKLRLDDALRGEGKRGGLRVIDFRWEPGGRIGPFTLYRKGEVSDMTAKPRSTLRTAITSELDARKVRWRIRDVLLIHLVIRYPDTIERLARL